jgi:flagellar hook-associated protein 2
MASTGTISSLGVGSGLELQNILDQLREVDKGVITRKETEKTGMKAQLDEFNVVNNKLLTMKSTALDLSLSSTYLARTVTSSDEDVLTATVADGTSVQTKSITVDRIATQSTWLSGGMASEDAVVYVPTSQESTTGTALAPADPNYITQDDTLVVTYGSGDTLQTITVSVTNGMSLNDVIQAINEDDENGGAGSPSLYVTAETYTQGTDNYLRVKSTAAGSGEDNRVMITDQLTDVTLEALDKTFAFSVGEETFILTVAADTTMSQLVDLINDDTDNPGVTASIIDDGAATDPYKMVLQSDNTGADYQISMLAQVPDLTFSVQGQTGTNLNAQITINGISYQRQTNTVSDVLTGVTLSLISADTASVTVANNNTAVQELIVSLVEAYNDAVQEIQSKTQYDEETDAMGMLARTTIRDLPYDLQSLMTGSVKVDTDAVVTTLFDLGMTFNRDGTITIDESVLAAAISSSPDDVMDFFLGDDDEGITGMADLVNDYLRVVTGADGQVAAEKSATQVRIDDLELQIENQTERLDKKYDILAKQFIQLDRYMNQMTSMSNYLSSQFDSLSSLLGGSNG